MSPLASWALVVAAAIAVALLLLAAEGVWAAHSRGMNRLRRLREREDRAADVDAIRRWVADLYDVPPSLAFGLSDDGPRAHLMHLSPATD